MRKYTLLIAMFCAAATVAAQESPKPTAKPADKKASIQLYGFVRNYFSFDSRRMITVCGGEYLMVPYDEDWNMTEAEAETYGDEHRFDRNAVPETRLLALTTRVGANLMGPQLLGASSSGKVEADFAGFGTTNSVLRLRLAYVKLNWEASERASHELLVGQDWHPVSGSIMPEVLGMAAGAPFRAHSRTPQVRYTFATPSGLGFTAAALWQFQFTSPGPDGESAAYANRALVPELFLGLNYHSRTVYAQLGVDYTDLAIRREIPVIDIYGGEPYTTLHEGHCRSFSPTLYAQYTEGLLAVKLRSTLAQNLGHLNMFSGYAWVADAGSQDSYQPVRSSVSYLNVAYGKRIRFDIFFGYQKNLGLPDGYKFAIPAEQLYMKKGVKNIDHIVRLAPSISYNTAAFNLGLEYECNLVGYGTLQSDATVADPHSVFGHRICALVKYNF